MTTLTENGPLRRALYALYGLLSSSYALSEELGLFGRAPKDQTPSEAAANQADSRVLEWCWSNLNTMGWDVGAIEKFADQITRSVLEQAQAASHLGPQGLEAFILIADLLVLDEFCAISEKLGLSCGDTWIPPLRRAFIELLAANYGLDLAAPLPDQKPILDEAQELASRWSSWAKDSDISPA